jgi:16S rRNA (cytosine1402-N4)-methyltransferase
MVMQHVPVLLHESIDGLNLKSGDTVIDATLGAGGHSSEIARQFGSSVQIVGFDLDTSAIALAQKAVAQAGGKLTPIHANFRTIKSACEEKGIHPNAVLFDLGISSMEIGKSGRGFSFMHDEPLQMTLNDNPTEEDVTAQSLISSLHEEELANIIFEYGEERFSRRIAKAIVQARRKEKILTTGQLVEIIKSAVPAFYTKGRIHPATRTFQALRIAVNDEFGAIKQGLAGAWDLLPSGGRIAVITFHSLEDRIVKNIFKEYAKEEGRLIVKKPVIPTREEIISNPRARSAKLRIIEKK